MAPQITPSEDSPETIACDALVVGAFEGDGRVVLDDSGRAIDHALDGYLTEYMSEAGFRAKPAKTITLPTMRRIPARAVVVAGLGPRDEVSSEIVRRSAGVAAKGLAERETIALALHRGIDGDAAMSAAIEGLLLGNYRYGGYKAEPKPSKIQQIRVLGGSERTIERAAAIAEATALARDLSNMPPNFLTPDALARKAKEVADVNGLECTVWDEKNLAEKGFGGVLGVARGSNEAPRFIQLRYLPENPTGRVALVGKGVTFDSGGYSLKDAKSMETMKADMGGAAAVIATMGALKRIGATLEVLAFIPTTENLVGHNAIKPGEVITHYNGRTTEVNNTDAEGRLILADALAFACEQGPEAVVDIATLTGGIMVALGLKSTGMFTDDDSLCAELEGAAEAAGERIWRMPIYDDYKEGMASDVADMKNSGPRWGSPIIGAIFLKPHVKKGIPWAHLDIAGADWADKGHEEGPKGATGAGTRTLIHWIESRGTDGSD
jgi:leucyl aminopeptidase